MAFGQLPAARNQPAGHLEQQAWNAKPPCKTIQQALVDQPAVAMVSDGPQAWFSSFVARYVLSVVMVLLISHAPLTAQRARQAMVMLRNGEMVKGVILSRDEAGVIRIENSCGIRLISPSEIDTIIGATKGRQSGPEIGKYYNLSSLTLLFGEGEGGFVPLPSLTTSFGLRFSRSLTAGAGLGFEYYQWPVLPIYAEARYLLRDEDVLLPWIGIRAGGAVPLVGSYAGGMNYSTTDGRKTHGGLMVNPEAGILLPLSQRTGLTLSLGYHHQRLSYDSPMIDWRFGTQIGTRRIYTHYNRINFRLGLFFN